MKNSAWIIIFASYFMCYHMSMAWPMHETISKFFEWDQQTDVEIGRDKRDASCQDIRTNCQAADCTNNPWEALQNCASTCNNCNGCSCSDAKAYSAQWCPKYAAQKDLCSVRVIYQKCISSCKQCSKIQNPSCFTTKPPTPTTQTCLDKFTNCTQQLCDQTPYKYLPNCRATCNNCDSCKCYDTADTVAPLCNNTQVTPGGVLCIAGTTYKRCPKKCKRCGDFQPSSCVLSASSQQ